MPRQPTDGGGAWWAYVDDTLTQPLCYVSAYGQGSHLLNFGVMQTNWTAPTDTFLNATGVGGAQTFNLQLRGHARVPPGRPRSARWRWRRRSRCR